MIGLDFAAEQQAAAADGEWVVHRIDRAWERANATPDRTAAEMLEMLQP